MKPTYDAQNTKAAYQLNRPVALFWIKEMN